MILKYEKENGTNVINAYEHTVESGSFNNRERLKI
jgi:hypothetical protein